MWSEKIPPRIEQMGASTREELDRFVSEIEENLANGVYEENPQAAPIDEMFLGRLVGNTKYIGDHEKDQAAKNRRARILWIKSQLEAFFAPGSPELSQLSLRQAVARVSAQHLNG